MQNAVAKS